MMSLFEISIVECTSIVNKISFKCETLQKLEKCQSREGDDVSAAALEKDESAAELDQADGTPGLVLLYRSVTKSGEQGISQPHGLSC